MKKIIYAIAPPGTIAVLKFIWDYICKPILTEEIKNFFKTPLGIIILILTALLMILIITKIIIEWLNNFEDNIYH